MDLIHVKTGKPRPLLIYMGIFLFISSLLSAQQQPVQLSGNNLTLKSAFKQIEQQTGLFIDYNVSEINDSQVLQNIPKRSNVKNVIDQLLTGTNSVATFANGHIIIRKQVNVLSSRRRITGVVKDDKGEPIIGANVVEKGTTNGIITDIEGRFQLEVSSNAILAVTYIGYNMQEVSTKEKNEIEIILSENTKALEEVVVVGYGTQKKVNLTGSIAIINFDKQALSRPITNISSALSGLSAGVQVRQSSGNPGSDGATIRVRGVGTLNNSDPLIIVDGIEGSLDAVNPTDVESISILKDAASSAIYGSRAANGVVLVTTKKGNQDKINVSYSARLSFSSPTNLIDQVTNYADYMEWMNESLTNIGQAINFQQTTIDLWREKEKDSNGINEFGYPNYIAYPNTDWQKVLFKSNLMNEHNISLNGSTNKVSFLVSAGYLDNPGLVDKTGIKRYSFRSNVDVKVTDWLNIGNRTYASLQDKEPGDFSGANNYLNLTTPGVTPIYNGVYGWPEASEESATANNLLYVLNTANGTNQNSQINTTLYSKMKFLNDFTYSFNLNYNRQWIEKRSWSTPADRVSFSDGTVKSPATLPANLTTSFSTNGNWSWTIQNLVNYSKLLNEDHSFEALAGHEEFYYYSYSNNATKKGLIDPSLTVPNAATEMVSIGGSASDYSTRSFFGRLNYAYKQRYLFEANLRYDGSSRFDKSNRFGVFPSFSGAWRISEEAFMDGSRSWLDNLKLRASWGKLGNNSVGNYAYQATYNSVNYSLGGTAVSALAANSIANSLLQWESTAITNIGLDMLMLHNRLTVELDAYHKLTDGILYQPSIYLTMGVKTAPYKNIAEVKNRGIETTIGWSDRKGAVDYFIKGNLAYNKNEVSKYKGTYEAGWVVGENGEKTYKTNIGDVSTGSATRVVEGKTMNEYYLLKPYSGNGSHFNADGSVNIAGGPKDGMIRTEEDMSWLTAMVAAGYNFYPNQTINKSKIWYGDYIYADSNGDGIYGNSYDSNFMGSSSLPKFNFGLQMGASYKNIDVSMNWAGAAGFDLLWGPVVGYNSTGTRIGYGLMKDVAYNHYFYDPANPNDERTNLYAKYPRLTCNESSSQNAQQSSLFLYSGDYLKLKNLTVGYTLPSVIAKRVLTQSIRLYFSGENLFTITSFPGQDPELGASPGYTSIKQISFGANITF
ncbi:TonB-dependent receptor [Parabacteroides sp. Marseille-P3160]|uniref:SusC/RagA family TonB-linked outer membrane protein n=1 Tax=Parabacteroides sp. Marseille-P3160 TaxID=1917887 RepID=UPI001F24AA80|nr:TonB-dependent receptor [Parabacteroides sp. Marseille-P3160]